MSHAVSTLSACSGQQRSERSKSPSKQGGRIVSILKTADGKRHSHRRWTSVAEETNNSMPLEDIKYTAPELPTSQVAQAYDASLVEKATELRNSFRPERCNFVALFLRVRKPHFEPLLKQCMASGVIPKDHIYSPKYLSYWTTAMRIRVCNSVPLSKVMEGMKHRLGVTHPGLRFCIDGFFGMIHYTDVFRNQDACPWMEVCNNSTVQSLKLRDGDSIFISIATIGQIENVDKHRKKKSHEIASASEPVDMAPQFVRVSRASWGRQQLRFEAPA